MPPGVYTAKKAGQVLAVTIELIELSLQCLFCSINEEDSRLQCSSLTDVHLSMVYLIPLLVSLPAKVKQPPGNSKSNRPSCRIREVLSFKGSKDRDVDL